MNDSDEAEEASGESRGPICHPSKRANHAPEVAGKSIRCLSLGAGT